jgi:hypothetical protein
VKSYGGEGMNYVSVKYTFEEMMYVTKVLKERLLKNLEEDEKEICMKIIDKSEMAMEYKSMSLVPWSC